MPSKAVDSLITQMFFDNESFYRFRECCELADINTPIVAGIHLYTMNDDETAKYIWQATRSLFENGRKVHRA